MNAQEPQKVQPLPAVFVHSPGLDAYPYPPDCPFSSARAGKTRAILSSMGLLGGADRQEAAPQPAGREDLEAFHAGRYLDVLRAATGGHLDVEGLAMGIGTQDTPVFAGLYEYASLACGATLTAAGLILNGQARAAFNPSGGYHHAGPARAAGFCYLNDVVLGCLRLTGAGKRVVFLDLDAHHGDGVQRAFYDRSDVMTISLHESGHTLFPGTGFEEEIGVGDGTGYSVNLPMPSEVHDEALLRAFEKVAVPLIGVCDPDVIVMELGMDGLAGDPLTHMALTNNAYADAIEQVRAFGRPILAVGGGGYHIPNTVRGWALCWTVLCGANSRADDVTPGMGGVLLETTEWYGGLRDRRLAPPAEKRAAADQAVDATIEKVQASVFPLHGL